MPTSDGRRVVVVTGASAGIGRATVQLLAKQGDAVGLLARGEAGLDAALAEVVAAGSVGVAVPTDVADAAAVEAAADRIETELGPIDVWINVAFSSIFAEFWDIEPEEFERITDVTYLGFVNGTRAALKRMRPRNSGVIVQTGSALSRRGIPLQTVYCGAKFAINGFTEAVRTELMHDKSKIKISVVQMPALNTPQFDWVLSRLPKKSQPVPPIYDPSLAADALVNATHHYRREWFVGLPTWAAIWGNYIAPNFLDHYMARTSYKAQQNDEPTAPDRPSNLWEPVDRKEAWSARGSYTGETKKRSLHWMLNKRRNPILGAGVAAAAAVAAIASSRR